MGRGVAEVVGGEVVGDTVIVVVGDSVVGAAVVVVSGDGAASSSLPQPAKIRAATAKEKAAWLTLLNFICVPFVDVFFLELYNFFTAVKN